MTFPHIDKDRNSHKIPDAKQSPRRYIVWFKPKDERQNKQDDKLEILKSTLGLGDYNNVFDVLQDIRNDAKRQQAKKNERTITDINKYTTPFLILRLTDEQVIRLKKHPDIKSVIRENINYPDIQTVPPGIDRVKTQQGWQISEDAGLRRKGDGVLTVCMDTGVNASHNDLDVHQAITFTDMDLDDFSIPAGEHGTHVAGTMAAKDNNIGVVGVAPDCLLIDNKVFNSEGGASDGDVIEAVIWNIEHRTHVINMSFGNRNPAPPNEAERAVMFDFVNSGGIILAAMGNEGLKVPDYPGNSHYPSAFPECVAVSAIDHNDVPADFTNFGPPVEISAPGVSILSTVLNNNYDFKNGTSMASPHVAGCCALALSNFRWNDCNPVYQLGGGGPSLNRGVMLRQILRDTADKNVEFPFQGRNESYGFGVVQADKMVEKLLLRA